MTILNGLLRYQKGFTLIELLVVMAVIAVLAGIVLAGVNPLQQLARGRDANRINAISGMGRAMLNYATVTNGGTYPAYSATWQNPLDNSGEISTPISLPSLTTNCPATSMHTGSNICYVQIGGGTDAAVWTLLESDLSKSKANSCATVAAYVWVASKGKAGYACLSLASDVPSASTTLY